MLLTLADDYMISLQQQRQKFDFKANPHATVPDESPRQLNKCEIKHQSLQSRLSSGLLDFASDALDAETERYLSTAQTKHIFRLTYNSFLNIPIQSAVNYLINHYLYFVYERRQQSIIATNEYCMVLTQTH